jgi:hypothetical protein
LGYVFTKSFIEKTAKLYKLAKQKYLCWDNETWSEPVPGTHKHTEKIAGYSHFQGHCN